MKVRRQDDDLLDLGGRANEEVRGLVVQPSESSNDITDVCAYAELSHPPNVDGDLHRRHLTTERRRENSRIESPLQISQSRCFSGRWI